MPFAELIAVLIFPPKQRDGWDTMTDDAPKNAGSRRTRLKMDAEARKERLAQQLRENLRRRKDQGRQRRNPAPEQD